MSISSSSNHNNNNNNGGARRLFHKLKVLIIGGGLGGLALANSLLEHPDMIEFWIFERDSHEGGFRPQGYRIGLDAEGIAALAACGISETRLRASGLDAESLSEIKIGDAQTLKVLLGFPAFGGGVVSRWLLHETLREKVVDHIVYSKAFASFESRPSGVTAIFQDGSRVEADMIIGADGIASKVRQQWVPSLQLLDSGVTGLAGNVTLKELQDAGTQIPRILQISEHSLVRLLGPGAYTWLFLRYTDEKTSQPNLIWVLNHHVESPERDYNPDGPPEAWLNFAKQVSRDAHPELAALVASTPPHCLLKPRHQCHLSSQAVAANPFAAAAAAHPRIALLGDAAHAMTTHRGQGANTAFMDAQDLSRAIFDIARERYNDATDFNLNHLMTYHATCSRRGATRIAGSLSSTTSMHTRSKIFRLIQVLIMRCVNFFLMIYFFLKRILKRP